MKLAIPCAPGVAQTIPHPLGCEQSGTPKSVIAFRDRSGEGRPVASMGSRRASDRWMCTTAINFAGRVTMTQAGVDVPRLRACSSPASIPLPPEILHANVRTPRRCAGCHSISLRSDPRCACRPPAHRQDPVLQWRSARSRPAPPGYLRSRPPLRLSNARNYDAGAVSNHSRSLLLRAHIPRGWTVARGWRDRIVGRGAAGRCRPRLARRIPWHGGSLCLRPSGCTVGARGAHGPRALQDHRRRAVVSNTGDARQRRCRGGRGSREQQRHASRQQHD